MATFATTANQTGLASATLTNGTARTFNLDLHTKLGATIEVRNTGGTTVTSGSVVNIAVYTSSDGSTYTTTPMINPSITTVVSTLQSLSFYLNGGSYYQISISNTDTTHTVTSAVIYLTIDSIG